MKPFEYISVCSVEQAADRVSEYGSEASILAGGTDLLIEWRRPSNKVPRVVVDISTLEELKGISSNDRIVTIGPLATHKEISTSSVVREFAPLLSTASASVGSPQIRNRGTVGGNIMNAATCADTIPPLIALGATITLRSQSGSRQIGLVDLFVKPYQTNARTDEVLTSIQFPQLPARTQTAFCKLGRRNALSIARLSVAAIITKDSEGRITDARIAPGAAFPTWRRVSEAEQILVGEKPSGEMFDAAGRKVSEMMIAETGRRWSTEYKEPVIAVLVRRALEACN